MIFDFDISEQPDETTCGPACLHAVYRYYGDDIPLDRVGEEVTVLVKGGTLAVMLGMHALQRGYEAVIYTCNLIMFDPSWFQDSAHSLQDRLREQARAKNKRRLSEATTAYLEYLDNGGVVQMCDITAELMAGFIAKGVPIIVGLSATWLYQCTRERPTDFEFDDIRGEPTGHFVVVHGFDPETHQVHVADPYCHQPLPGTHHYTVEIDHLVAAILLGIVTYDAKLLIVIPRQKT